MLLAVITLSIVMTLLAANTEPAQHQTADRQEPHIFLGKWYNNYNNDKIGLRILSKCITQLLPPSLKENKIPSINNKTL